MQSILSVEIRWRICKNTSVHAWSNTMSNILWSSCLM
jgi:hypothetical protein